MRAARWFLIAALLILSLAAVRSAPAADRELQRHISIVKHATDVERFFRNHPRLARTRAGRDACWQQKRAKTRALERIRVLRRQRWLELPYTEDWKAAVTIAQRPYPGTRDFLWNTSAREGGHGGCVEYGGAPCALPVYGVAGNLQYMKSTFSAHYRRALEDLARRGFSVPGSLSDAQSVTAWFSPLAQALAGGWACYRHQTFSHWSASGMGCG